MAVAGLGDLRRFVRDMDRRSENAEALPEFRNFMRRGAQIVVDDARRRAPRGTRPIPPGRSPRKRLVDNIRPRVRGDTAFIVSLGTVKTAAPPKNLGRFGAKKQWWSASGYRYTRRIEYEGSGGNRSGYGPRGFLGPALEAKSDEVARHMEGVLDAIETAWRN